LDGGAVKPAIPSPQRENWSNVLNSPSSGLEDVPPLVPHAKASKAKMLHFFIVKSLNIQVNSP
jgi:hypothetical protein